jgi:hypothetical protein
MKGVVKPIPRPTRPLVDNQPSSWLERINARHRCLVHNWCAESPARASECFSLAIIAADLFRKL